MLTFKTFVLVKIKKLALEGQPFYKKIYKAAKAAAFNKG